MKLFKIITAEIVFYIVVFFLAVSYFAINGVGAVSQSDFRISVLMLIVLCAVTINKIENNMKAFKDKY